MTDAIGVAQFVHAVAEIARGESSLSVPPVWQRELLSARDPPHVTCMHPEYDEVHDNSTIGSNIVLEEKVRRSIFFGPTEIAALRSSIPPHPFPRPSTFDILTACIWRCHTVALQLNAEEEVRILFAVNARGKIQSTPFPTGYYGNVVACPVAISAAGNLCKNPLQFALELVMKAKGDVTEEYMRSLADFMVIKGRPLFYLVRTFVLSSLVRVGFAEVDFGWGKPVYGGPTVGGSDVSFYVDFTNAKGERGILVPICLPGPAMKSFEVELETLLKSGQL